MTVKFYLALADVVLAGHLLFIAWVVLGALVTRGRPRLRWLQIASVIYGAAALPWPCPLTLAENWLRVRAGEVPYQSSFLLHYLDALVNPNVPPTVVKWGLVGVCAFNLAVYAWRYRRYRHAW
jgi:hypothetical protein